MIKTVDVTKKPIAKKIDENACLLGIQSNEDGKQALYQMPIDLIIEKDTGGCTALIKDLTLPVESWENCEEVSGCCFTLRLTDKDIRSIYYPCVTVNTSSVLTARKSGLCPTAETFDGGIVFWTELVPTEPIALTAAFLVPSASGCDGTNYVLPVATSDTLGGIKLGDGLECKPDGTVSVYSELDDTMIASKHDISEMMTDVFAENYIPADGDSVIATKKEIDEMLNEVFTQ